MGFEAVDPAPWTLDSGLWTVDAEPPAKAASTSRVAPAGTANRPHFARRRDRRAQFRSHVDVNGGDFGLFRARREHADNDDKREHRYCGHRYDDFLLSAEGHLCNSLNNQ